MRVEQPNGARGSLKWIQCLVDKHPDALDKKLREAGALAVDRHLKWLAPLHDDKWAEYRDAQFLEKLGHADLAGELANYWPRRGPQWDALAMDESGRAFLIEAKAHAREMASTCKAGATSLRMITSSLEESKRALGAKPGSDWTKGYYQYANRLAHLHFLRKHAVDAVLVFLYFTGADDIGGPSSEAAWRRHVEAAPAHLGMPKNTPGVVSIFQDVGNW